MTQSKGYSVCFSVCHLHISKIPSCAFPCRLQSLARISLCCFPWAARVDFQENKSVTEMSDRLTFRGPSATGGLLELGNAAGQTNCILQGSSLFFWKLGRFQDWVIPYEKYVYISWFVLHKIGSRVGKIRTFKMEVENVTSQYFCILCTLLMLIATKPALPCSYFVPVGKRGGRLQRAWRGGTRRRLGELELHAQKNMFLVPETLHYLENELAQHFPDHVLDEFLFLPER